MAYQGIPYKNCMLRTRSYNWVDSTAIIGACRKINFKIKKVLIGRVWISHYCMKQIIWVYKVVDSNNFYRRATVWTKSIQLFFDRIATITSVEVTIWRIKSKSKELGLPCPVCTWALGNSVEPVLSSTHDHVGDYRVILVWRDMSILIVVVSYWTSFSYCHWVSTTVISKSSEKGVVGWTIRPP
jgi:hypothetical protein